MPIGRVKWFSLEKGFGFISSEEGEDVYLAASALPSGVPTVKPGTKLEFGVAEGRRALKVNLIIKVAQVHRPGTRAAHPRRRQPVGNVNTRLTPRDIHRPVIGHPRERAAGEGEV